MSKKRRMQDYPEAYFRIVERLAKDKTPMTVKMAVAEAKSSRRDLYRFFAAIREAEREGDAYASQLSAVSQHIVLGVTLVEGSQDEAILAAKLNPLTRMLGEVPQRPRETGSDIAEGVTLDLDEVESLVKDIEKGESDA